MKEKFAKLIDVKSIMTLLLTIVFCVLALIGVISGQEFLTIFTVIVGFYFGTQSKKNAAEPTAPGKNDQGTTIPTTAPAPITAPVDASMVQAIHPPDGDTEGEAMQQIGFV